MSSDPQLESGAEHRRRAEEVYFAGLEAAPGAAIDIESLCDRHPSLADELTVVHALRLRALQALDGSGAGEPSDRPTEGPRKFLAGRNRYEVRRTLALGGMGVILVVHDRNLGRLLAMKRLRSADDRPDEDSRLRMARRRSRLLNEAEILGQLDHPAIVPVIDVGTWEDGELFFTMQLVRGRSFREVIASFHGGDADWTLARAIDVVVRVCDAMAHAHARGVLHRDLKPDNIMVGPFGEVYVMDWGLAKAAGRSGEADLRIENASSAAPVERVDHVDASAAETGSRPHTPPESVRTGRRVASDSDPLSPLVTLEGDVIGTPAYMPPEQALGRIDDLDERSDVYSLGAVLYHLLTGRPPYTDEESAAPWDILRRVADGPPRPLGPEAPAIPTELVAICDQAIERRPEERYADAAELAADLRAWSEGHVVRAHRTGSLVELRKWVGRHRGAASAISIAIVGVLVLAMVQTFYSQRLRESNVTQRLQLYRSEIAIAERALRDGYITRALQHLSATPVEHRNWEWSFLHRKLHEFDLALPVPHGERALMLKWSPDGRRLAAGTDRGSLLVWSMNDLGREPYRVDVGSRPMSVLFPPSGDVVAVGADDRAGVWDGRGPECQLRIELGIHGPSHLDGERVMVSGDGVVGRRWDLRTGERLPDMPLPLPGVFATALNTDFTFSNVFRFGLPLQALSADGRFAVVIDEGWNLTLRDGRTGELLGRASEPVPEFRALRLSPDGRRLGIATENDTYLVDFNDGGGQLEPWSTGHESRFATWSPDGRALAMRIAEAIRIHLVDDRRDVPVTLAAAAQFTAAYSPDGRWLASSSWVAGFQDEHPRSRIVLWDLERFERGNHLWLSDSQVRQVALSPDETRVAAVTRSGRLVILDARMGSILASNVGRDDLVSVEWTHDGRQIAVGTEHGRVNLHPSDDLNRKRVIHAASGRIDCIAFFDDDRRMLVTSNGHEVTCLDATSGEVHWESVRKDARIVWADVSPDESLVAVAGYEAREAYLLDAASGRELRRWSTNEKCGRVLFAPDGESLFIGGRTSSLWSFPEERFLWKDKLCPGLVITPDGTRIIGGTLGLLEVFELDTGERVFSFETPAGHSIVHDISRDGMTVYGTTRSGHAAWWDARPWDPSRP